MITAGDKIDAYVKPVRARVRKVAREAAKCGIPPEKLAPLRGPLRDAYLEEHSRAKGAK